MTILRDDAGPLTIMEKMIEDPVSGLTIQYEVLSDGTQKLKMFGGFPLGEREFIFNPEDLEGGAGVRSSGHPSRGASRTACD